MHEPYLWHSQMGFSALSIPVETHDDATGGKDVTIIGFLADKEDGSEGGVFAAIAFC
jgi:hypothetical protein